MNSISKSVYIDNLGDIVNKYKNTYHSQIQIIIKLRPADVKKDKHVY